MSTFLALCQEAAQESGVVTGAGPAGSSSAKPTSTASQVDKLGKVVVWVARAWNDIQNERPNWRWMRREFTGKPTIANVSRYTAAGWTITDFANWMIDDPERGYRPHSIYDPAIGLGDEQELRRIDYDQWRVRFGRGLQTNQRPQLYAISPTNEFCLGPIPEKVYLIRGENFKNNQALVSDADVPECPARFHSAVMWRAVRYLCEFDEAPFPIAAARAKETDALGKLERDQLETIVIGSRPLA